MTNRVEGSRRSVAQKVAAAFDIRSLFFRIAMVVGGAGMLLSVTLSGLYYQQLMQKGIANANVRQQEMLHMFSTQIVQDVARNVTRRIENSLVALSERVADVYVYGAVHDKDGVLMVEHGAHESLPAVLLQPQFDIVRETMQPVVLLERQTVISPAVLPNGNLSGFTLMVWDRDAIRAPIVNLALVAAGVLALSFLVWTTLLIVMMRRLVGKPLGAISGALADLEVETFNLASHDFGNLTQMKVIRQRFQSLETALSNAARARDEQERANKDQSTAIDRLSGGLAALANRDLASQIDRPFAGQYEVLRTDFNTAQTAMGATLNAISGICFSFDQEIGQLVEASTDLSTRAGHQAQTLTDILFSLSEAAEHTGSAVERAKGVRSIVVSTNETVEKSGTVVDTAVTAMSEIESSSVEVQKIIGVIEDIAFQTNLLALNAAVEASRAGDAGRGFSVVASEVQGLSNRTTEAASEIRGLISSSVNQVKSGADLVRNVGVSLKDAIESVRTIDTEVNGLVETFVGYSETLSGVSGGAKTLEQATQESAQMAENMKTSTDQLHARSVDLQQSVSEFVLPDDIGIKRRGLRAA